MHNQSQTEPVEPDKRKSWSPRDSAGRPSPAPRGRQGRFSPLRFLMFTIGGIFLAEVVAMAVLINFQTLPYTLQTLIDASVMILLIFPLVYFLSLKPLLQHIEERRRAEQALHQSEERFTKAFHSSPAALSITRLADGTFLDVNESFLRMLGYQREEVVGHTSIELGLWRSAEQRAEIMPKDVLCSGMRDYEMMVRTKSGNLRDVLLSTQVIELGGEACILATGYDITERKQAEDLNLQLSRIVEQTEDTVVVTDCDGMIEYVNSAFERLTGYAKGEARGKTLRVIKSGIHNDEFYRNLWQTILRGDIFQGEIANRKKNGELYYEVKTITPLRDEPGDITHFVATGKDITEHKLDEERLRQAYDELELRVQERTEELRIANSELEEEIAVRKRAETEIQQYAEELRAKNEELTHFNQIMVGRELRMIELKKEVNELCTSTSQAPRYPLDFENE